MYSLLSSSQGAILATTAMVVSGTFVLLSIFRDKNSHSDPPLRSCLSSSSGGKKKNKKVHFADNVKDSDGNSQEFRRKYKQVRCGIQSVTKHDQIIMPPNRMALYQGILRDRMHRISC